MQDVIRIRVPGKNKADIVHAVPLFSKYLQLGAPKLKTRVFEARSRLRVHGK